MLYKCFSGDSLALTIKEHSLLHATHARMTSLCMPNLPSVMKTNCQIRQLKFTFIPAGVCAIILMCHYVFSVFVRQRVYTIITSFVTMLFYMLFYSNKKDNENVFASNALCPFAILKSRIHFSNDVLNV